MGVGLGYLRYINLPYGYFAVSGLVLLCVFIYTRKVGVSIVAAYAFIILAFTVLSRKPNNASNMNLIPFWSYKQALTDEYLRFEIWANIALFIPFGFFLSLIKGKLSILYGFLFSCCIEVIQLLCHRGLCEIDDVVSNVIGILIGYIVYLIGKFLFCIIRDKLSCWEEGSMIYRRYTKRMLDILIGVSILIILSPLMLVTAVLIKLESPGPVIFKQKRIGYKAKVFEMYKFRSMFENSEHTGSGVYSDKNDSRVTKVGRIIRATSIDELPQAWNMLKGDMSLVGPRPPLTYHPWPIEDYTKEQLHMFDVRPGITGWAQINGRKDVEWNQRIKMNNWYVDNMSFVWDCKIFAHTVLKVLTMADNENKGETVKK